jgi:hypothetical protein
MRTLLLSCLIAGSAAAQTTGVPGINDLTMNSIGSGATSCVTQCYPNGNVTLTYMVSVAPGAIPFVMFNFCPCLPCSLTAPSNFCSPAIPATACFGSNQSLDLDLNAACGPVLFLPVGPTTTGVVGVSITVPPIPGPPCTNVALTAQAMILDLCGAGLTVAPGPFVFSQAITALF